MTPKAEIPQKKPRSRTAAPAVRRTGVTLIGCGNWGTALALALHQAAIPVREIVVRTPRSRRHRQFAAALGAGLTTLEKAVLDADVFWIATPDAAIAGIARQLAAALKDRRGPATTGLIAFHSSGALSSAELAPLRSIGVRVAAVHPLMTFPRRTCLGATSQPYPLAGVPFAIEGDPRACRAARTLARAFHAEAFALPAESKPLYHAFGAFASPLLTALLTAAMETAVAAGQTRKQARRRMQPIVERTIANFFAEGPEKSFSGPIARGDATTIARHLEALRAHPRLLAAYRELARFSLHSLPAPNQKQMHTVLDRT